MTVQHSALVIGEALIDIVRNGSEQALLPGGSCANVAVALARLGRRTSLATRYGDDHFGDLLDAHFQESRVRVLPGSRRHGVRTSSADATLGPDGSATYRFDVSWDVELPANPAQYSVVHVGSIGAVMSPGADTVEQAVEILRRSATTSYDVNARPALFGDADDAVARASRLVAASDVVKASDDDLAWLHPRQPVEDVAAAWLDLGAAAVLVTRGATGASVFTRLGRIDVDGVPTQVVDTIGAGDTFSAAVVDGLCASGLTGAENRERLRALALAQWRRIAEYAALAASVAVSRPGADPPYPAELPPKPSMPHTAQLPAE